MKILLASAVALAVTISAAPAFAAGALVVGVAPNVATGGFSAGLNGNLPSASAARNEAMQQCRTGAGAPASTRALCRLVNTYTNRCSAIAADPRPKTPGLGWSIARSSQSAGNQALARCKATAGARARFCEVIAIACDGRAQ